MNKNYIVAGILTRSTKGSAGYDISLPCDILIKPDEVRIVQTDVKVNIRNNCFGLIAARSSLYNRTGCIIINSPSIVDSDYIGDEDLVHIHIKNISNKEVFLNKGDRIAQLCIIPYETFCNEEVPTKDRQGGHGSTGI